MAKNYRIIVKTVISYVIKELRIGEMEKSKKHCPKLVGAT